MIDYDEAKTANLPVYVGICQLRRQYQYCAIKG